MTLLTNDVLLGHTPRGEVDHATTDAGTALCGVSINLITTGTTHQLHHVTCDRCRDILTEREPVVVSLPDHITYANGFVTFRLKGNHLVTVSLDENEEVVDITTTFFPAVHHTSDAMAFKLGHRNQDWTGKAKR